MKAENVPLLYQQ